MNTSSTARLLTRHVGQLLACRRCREMHPPVVSGGPVVSQVMLVGQAPGDKEPKLGRPFAWTAGRTLFKWFEEAAGLTEAEFRSSIYMAAVCRCFPGKKPPAATVCRAMRRFKTVRVGCSVRSKFSSPA